MVRDASRLGDLFGVPGVVVPHLVLEEVDYFVEQAKRFIGHWGYEGLKTDGQHLNSVAPCYNPKHRHARPQESTESVALFWKAIHEAAHEAKSDALVELCPCGTR
ncbi:hypothetical protein AB0I22_37895 [Streptomyces sp. NPDC050610]|uniref:hypothetical protein n=1 Tax=Streptomyces sp. NPDC050610 TaxID=3157097 RepID=UPI00343D5EB5